MLQQGWPKEICDLRFPWASKVLLPKAELIVPKSQKPSQNHLPKSPSMNVGRLQSYSGWYSRVLQSAVKRAAHPRVCSSMEGETALVPPTHRALWVVRVHCSPNGLFGKCLPVSLPCLLSVFRLQDKCKVQQDEARKRKQKAFYLVVLVCLWGINIVSQKIAMWINHVPISGHIGLVLSLEPCKRSLQFGRSTLWFLFFPCYLIAQMMGQTAPSPNWHWNRGTCFCLGLGTDTSRGPFQSHLFHGFMMTPLNLKYWTPLYHQAAGESWR